MVALQLIPPTLERKSARMLTCWEHVDVEKADWRFPAENSKSVVEHCVSVAARALGVDVAERARLASESL
jgi:hypothetical protein